MKTSMQPMEIQSNFLRDELRQYAIPARGGQSRLIIVEKVRRRSKLPVSSKVQEPVDHYRD